MSESQKFRALELSILLCAQPRDLNVLCLVCRRWRIQFEKDAYWYRHRNHVIKHIPMLNDAFAKGIPIWQVFVRQLLIDFKNKLSFSRRFEVAPRHVKEAIIYAGHGMPEMIDGIRFFSNSTLQIIYKDSSIGTVFLQVSRREPDPEWVGKVRKLARTLPAKDFHIPVCSSVRHQTGDDDGFVRRSWIEYSPGKCALQMFYGPYMDIVTCNPKGVRFRNKQGYADDCLRKHNVLYFEKPK